MYLTTRIYTAFFGELVGEDAFGNRYYRRKGKTHGDSSAADRRRKEKRWVMYRGTPEPSKVPAEWHGWLHYTFDTLPSERGVLHYRWEKPHLPNLTGTKGAYVPPGHIRKGAERDASTADYQAWKP